MSNLEKGSLLTWHLRENTLELWLKKYKFTDLPIEGNFKFHIDRHDRVIGKFGSLESLKGILVYFETLNNNGDYSEQIQKLKDVIKNYNIQKRNDSADDKHGDRERGNDTGDAAGVQQADKGEENNRSTEKRENDI